MWPQGQGRRDRQARDFLVTAVSSGTLTGTLKLQRANANPSEAAEANRTFHDVGSVALAASGSLQVLNVLGKYVRAVLTLSAATTAATAVTLRAV